MMIASKRLDDYFAKMEKKSRLGRGLSGLLNVQMDDPAPPDIAPQSPTSRPTHNPTANPTFGDSVTGPKDREMFHVELSRIVANPDQPRKNFDATGLAELAQSIMTAGVIQPIIVKQVEDHFQLIAGERRWRAAQLAKLETIPVILRAVEPVEQAQIALIENIHRKDLNPIERAIAYRQLLQTAGLTHQELAARLGEDRSIISNHLRLLELDLRVQQLILNQFLSLGHAKLLAGIDDPAEQLKVANHAALNQLSVRQLEAYLTTPATGEKPVKVKNAHLADLERQLSRELQMRTEVKQGAKGGKGRLVIHYASLDQFDQIMTRLGVKIDD